MLETKGVKLRLEPQDEYTHPIEEEKNFNESMYINIFDPSSRLGGWFRVGNRPNEGYAEMTCCLYLPDGRVGFMFGRPEISGNDALDAAGLRFEIVEPLKRLRLTYDGKLLLLADPHAMARPRKAFSENPLVDCKVHLEYEGVAPVFGGEKVNEDGTSVKEKEQEAFARAHYEQHVAGRGTIRVAEEEFRVDGYGLRDHSWGPRYWQNIKWYRWLPMSFGKDFGIMIAIITKHDDSQVIGGMVLRNGKYVMIEEARIETEWDENDYQKGLTAWARTAEREYEVHGKVLNLIPLRNRRKTPDGADLETRITEGMTEYRCDGRVGYGMSEYLDQIVDGRPVGAAAG
jgi:hypothetical protein